MNEYMLVMNSKGEYNFLTPSMTFLSNIWYFDARPFDEFGIARIARRITNKEWNYINKDGNLLLKEWVKVATSFTFITIEIKSDKNYTYFDNTGAVALIASHKVNLFNTPYAYIEYTNSNGDYINIKGEIITNYLKEAC